MNEQDVLQYVYDNDDTLEYVDLVDYFFKGYPDASKEILKEIVRILNYLSTERLIHLLDDDCHYRKLGDPMVLTAKSKEGEYYSLETFKRFSQLSFLEGHTILAKITFQGRLLIENKRKDDKQNDLNDSFKTLNDNTIPKNNRTIRRLTRALLFSSGIYTLVATLMYTQQRGASQAERNLYKIKTELRDHPKSDTTFRQSVQDILEDK